LVLNKWRDKMIMQGNNKDKIVSRNSHIYMTLQLLAPNYYVKVVG
jgi:hypothetical protein